MTIIRSFKHTDVFFNHTMLLNMPFHKTQKRFGQHFLHDHRIIQSIIRFIHPKEADHIVEIGPGQGALTEFLLDGAGQLDIIELDRNLIQILKLRFGLKSGFRIHEGNALKFDFTSLRQGDAMLRVVGNLPYNISTPLIFYLLKFHGLIYDMYFMLQKEVVKRLIAQPGNKNYGRLGIMTKYYCKVDYVFTVKPSCFYPAPKIDSAIVRLKPYNKLPYPTKNLKLLEYVVQTAFQQRRKTMRNTLKKLISSEKLQQLRINPAIRPEQITLSEFITIADYLHDNKLIV